MRMPLTAGPQDGAWKSLSSDRRGLGAATEEAIVAILSAALSPRVSLLQYCPE
jgi:hypothetical protein